MSNPILLRGAGEISPDLCDSVRLELGYLLYSFAELGTDPRVTQSPNEWPLQSPMIMIVLFPGAAGTEGTTTTSSWGTQAGSGDFEGGSWD